MIDSIYIVYFVGGVLYSVFDNVDDAYRFQNEFEGDKPEVIELKCGEKFKLDDRVILTYDCASCMIDY